MIKNSNEVRLKKEVIDIILMIYFVLVLSIGIMYAIKDKGSNLLTIKEFVYGNRQFPIDAMIYTSIFQQSFTFVSIIGSFISFKMIYKNNVKNKVILFYIHIAVVISYFVSRFTLLQSVVHLSTQGAIKNNEFWDLREFFNSIINAPKILNISIILLIGLILIPISIYNKRKVKI